MKKLSLSLIGALSMLVLAGSAYAQTVHVRATIPFQFTIQNKTLPAGNYEVISQNMPNYPRVLELLGSNGPVMFISGSDLRAASYSKETKLVFQHYGTRYFLSQLWTEGSHAGLEFPGAAAEAREARNNPGQQVTLTAKLGK